MSTLSIAVYVKVSHNQTHELTGSRSRPMCMTKPEPPLMPMWSFSSGIRQTWNFLWKANSHASNTMCDLSCWAIIHTERGEDSAFGKRHKSAQVRTNGSISAPLNIQSHANIRSRLVSWGKFKPLEHESSNIGDIKLVSQSRWTILMLVGDKFAETSAAGFPFRLWPVLGDFGLGKFSTRLSFKVLNT